MGKDSCGAKEKALKGAVAFTQIKGLNKVAMSLPIAGFFPKSSFPVIAEACSRRLKKSEIKL